MHLRRAFRKLAAPAGALLFVVSTVLDGLNLVDLGLPLWAWQAIGGSLFFAAILYLVHEGTGTDEAGREPAVEQAVTERAYFENETVRLSDLVLDRLPAIIEDRVFNRCQLLGPAVLLPLSGTQISNNSARGMSFFEIREEAAVGVIGLRNCRIDRCYLVNIAFAAPTDQLQRIRENFPLIDVPEGFAVLPDVDS